MLLDWQTGGRVGSGDLLLCSAARQISAFVSV